MVQCKAKSKRSGAQCRKQAVTGKAVCKFHGANAGPKTAEGIARMKASKTKHGKYTKEAIKERRDFRELVTGFRKCLSGI